jgi:hypothetical protein
MDPSLERLARNQTLFREVNERLVAMTDGQGDWVAFLCECSRVDCAETIELSQDEYNKVRARATTFVIVPGHETPEVEDVVASNGRYDIVEKTEGVGFAFESDPRAVSSGDA